jgi:hypothetical protein
MGDREIGREKWPIARIVNDCKLKGRLGQRITGSGILRHSREATADLEAVFQATPRSTSQPLVPGLPPYWRLLVVVQDKGPLEIPHFLKPKLDLASIKVKS